MTTAKNTAEAKPAAKTMDSVVNLCTRRRLLFQSCEAYGGPAGFFDYGPLGTQLKRGLEQGWWKRFVESREDIVGLDGALLTPFRVWEASGHVQAFNDPLLECRKCKEKHRADELIRLELGLEVEGASEEELKKLLEKKDLKCPKCKGALVLGKPFNLMFETSVGIEGKDKAVLRPETAQLIFVDFKEVALAARKQPPFGIAQVGKAFRNEISPRQFVFRCREFSQFEIEYFMHPEKEAKPEFSKELLELELNVLTASEQEKNEEKEKQKTVKKKVKDLLKDKTFGNEWILYWLAEHVAWFQETGLKPESMRARQHVKRELSHYSKETWDVEFKFLDWGWKELMGVADRGDYDLKQHEKFSGKDFHLFDEDSKKKYLPVVAEPSGGFDRLMLALLVDAFGGRDGKTVLALSPKVAPVQVSVFPLMKKDGLDDKARQVFEALRGEFVAEYDESGSIGRRYARADEAGVPACVTIDYDSLKDDTVTVRNRDTGKQERVAAGGLAKQLKTFLA